MDADERARAELERLIMERREDFAGLSRLLGRNAAYMQQYFKRGTPKRLAENDRRTLAKYFGVDEALLGGPALRGDLGLAKLVPIPRLRIGASAGPGAFTDNERAVAHLAFDPGWLKQVTRAAPSDLSIIRVQGDSMHPTLSDGDEIMVDRSAANTGLVEGVYVLRRDDTLMVKRVAIHPSTRRLTISSDNSAYPSWRDCEPGSVEVVGKVVWAGRRIV
jgi:hypothetical protein